MRRVAIAAAIQLCITVAGCAPPDEVYAADTGPCECPESDAGGTCDAAPADSDTGSGDDTETQTADTDTGPNPCEPPSLCEIDGDCFAAGGTAVPFTECAKWGETCCSGYDPDPVLPRCYWPSTCRPKGLCVQDGLGYQGGTECQHWPQYVCCDAPDAG